MKNIFKTMAIAVMSISLMGMVACSEKNDSDSDPAPTPTPVDPTVNSSTFAFNYQNRTLEAGQTVYFYPTEQEVTNDWATVHLFFENKTNTNVNAYIYIEKVYGSDEMKALSVCFGETCKTGTCPWSYGPIALEPGVNTALPVLFDYVPSKAGNNTVYMIMIGNGENMTDPQVMYLSVSANAQ